MKQNNLGRSELVVGEIGLGCMSLGTEEGKAVAVIHEAIDRGVTLLDTADLYNDGLNERLVGKALKGRRDRVVLATKAGNRRIPGQDGWTWDASKAYIKTAAKASLRRLETDYIDLFQLHGGTMDDPIGETIEAFEELKKEGWIRAYGISSIRPTVIREYIKKSSVASVMNPFSIADRRAEEQVLPLLREHGVSVIARGPLAGGALAAHRESAKPHLGYGVEDLRSLRARLSELTGEGRSLTELAIRYSLSDPAVAAVVPGASSREQLLLNLKAAEVPALTETELAAIRDASEANRYEAHRIAD